jgi:hypothetical protein
MDKQEKQFSLAIRKLEKAFVEDIMFKYQYDNPESSFYLRNSKGNSGIKLTRIENKYSLSLWGNSTCGVYEDLIENFSSLNEHNQGILACLYDHLEKDQEKERELIRQKEIDFYSSKMQEDTSEIQGFFQFKKKKLKKNIHSRTYSIEDRL